VQRWVTDDLISLDVLTVITKLTVGDFDGFGAYRERGALYVRFSLIFTPFEVPYHGTPDKCSLDYCFKLDEMHAPSTQVLPKNVYIVNDSSFGRSYYATDPDGQYTSVNNVKSRIDELVTYWEQYKLQRDIRRSATYIRKGGTNE
jgi:hypothetical protein